jgi:hypothetical protein
MTTTQEITATARQIAAKASTTQLLEMVATLGAQIDSTATPTPELKAWRTNARLTIQWVYDELEARFPTSIPLLEKWIDADTDDRPYWQMMIDAVRHITR